MRILYAGTPDIAVPCLASLVNAGHRVEVLTNPDAPVGRGGVLTPPAVKAAALERGLVVHQPLRLDADVRAAFGERFDLLVSFAYGRIFGPLFLGLFPMGGVNVHPSLLPRWRGPSPLSAAIFHRDSQTGITVQRLALQMDSGPILARLVIPLTGSETTGSLTTWAAEASPALLTSVIEALESGTAIDEPQSEAGVTFCTMVSKDDGRIDWSAEAAAVDAQVRACDPWPGTFTSWNGQRLGVRQSSLAGPSNDAPIGTVVAVDKSNGILVQTGDGLVALREWQLPARKSLDFRSFLNGNPTLVGSRLGEFS